MKDIKYHRLFRKNFKARVAGKKRLVKDYKIAFIQFSSNPEHPVLKNHFLKGMLLGYRSFWVTNEIRIIYKETERYYIFYDIGTHKQVYGR